MRFLHVLASAVMLLGPGACTQTTRSHQQLPAFPAGMRAADGAAIDAATGLPKRIIHEPTGVVLVLVPAGEFARGDGKKHGVVTRPFYLGATEVTTDQFARFVASSGYLTDAERGTPDQGHTRGSFAALPGGNREWHDEATWRNPWPNLIPGLPGFRHTGDHPVVHVSWRDAAAFCSRYGFALPSETQWEYACRAGSTGTFPWGDHPAGGAGAGNVQDAAYGRAFAGANGMFPFDDRHAALAPAGSYKPNRWGLQDMVGNVEEWCEDDWQPRSAGARGDESAVVGSPRSGGRVLRGGWRVGATSSASAWRSTSVAERGRANRYCDGTVRIVCRPHPDRRADGSASSAGRAQ
jgi:formylglycine-generating enzyme